MRGQNEYFGTLHHGLQPLLRLIHEIRIAGHQPLIHQQDLRLDSGCQAEAQPDHHAGTIGPDRQIEELVQFGKGRDILFKLADLVCTQPVEQPAQPDILAPRELGIHALARIEQCGHLAIDADAAVHRFINTGQGAQQGRLARTVRPDKTKPVAGLQRKRHIAQRLNHHAAFLILAQPPGSRRQHRLLQAPALTVIKRK